MTERFKTILGLLWGLVDERNEVYFLVLTALLTAAVVAGIATVDQWTAGVAMFYGLFLAGGALTAFTSTRGQGDA